jgi:hypothetical protein
MENEVTFEDAIAYICKHKSGVENEDFKKGIGSWSSQLGMLGYMKRGKNGDFSSTWKATEVAYERNKRNRKKPRFLTIFSDFFFLHFLKI